MALRKFFSQGQVKECLKRLDARRKHLAWIECTRTDDGSLLELAIVVTDYSLNEVERGVWVFGGTREAKALSGAASSPQGSELLAELKASSLTPERAADEIVDFLRTHCVRGTCKRAGRRLAAQRELLSRSLPAVLSFMDSSDTLDLASGGINLYGHLIDRPVFENRTQQGSKAQGPKTLQEYEMEQASLGAHQSPLSAAGRAIDRIEATIEALGWAREHFIAPPKAAKYVTMGLNGLSAFLLFSVVRMLVFAFAS